MARLRVLEPGSLTTVQDLGRPGYATVGLSASGAADPVSLRIGNLLVGNPASAGALEMTLVGGKFECDAAMLVAVTGSDFEPIVAGASRRRIPPWSAVRLEPGEVLVLGPTRSGARSYLCVRGGIAVPPVLGSVSTHVLIGIGGFHGRRLHGGDLLPIGPDPLTPPLRLRAGRREIDEILFRRVLRVTRGPEADCFTAESVERLPRAEYQVSEEADRMGLRLLGPSLARKDALAMLTEGVCLGAVQVPESGQPIVLLVEQQTTGGYPKIASVVSADLPALGQLRPRDRVRFEWVTIATAHALLHAQERWLARVLEPA